MKRLRSAVRSFRRPAGWVLLPDHPRHTSGVHRVILGGRLIIEHYTPYDWKWWLHPLRAWVYRRECRRAHELWERQWGGDPSTRQIVLGESRLEACGRALLNPDPRLWLISQALDAEIALRQEHERPLRGSSAFSKDTP